MSSMLTLRGLEAYVVKDSMVPLMQKDTYSINIDDWKKKTAKGLFPPITISQELPIDSEL